MSLKLNVDFVKKQFFIKIPSICKIVKLKKKIEAEKYIFKLYKNMHFFVQKEGCAPDDQDAVNKRGYKI